MGSENILGNTVPRMTTEGTSVGEKERKYNSLGELIPNTGCLQLQTGTALVLPPLLEESSKKIKNIAGH